jgi:hypothetical protein
MKKYEVQMLLNQQGVPELDKKSKGGNIPDYSQFGTWLRRNDPGRFDVLFKTISA